MGYEVIQTGEKTVIRDNGSGLKVQVAVGAGTPGTAYGLGTLYQVKGGFVPLKVYLFQVISEVSDAEGLKKIAVFFFASLLDTELYVVEIPRTSALFPEEAQRIFGNYDHERAI